MSTCSDTTTLAAELRQLLSKARKAGKIIPISEAVIELRKLGEKLQLTGPEKLLFGREINKARERTQGHKSVTNPPGFILAKLLCMAKDLGVPFKQTNFDTEMIKGAFRRMQKSNGRRDSNPEAPDRRTFREYVARLEIPLDKAV